MPPSFHPAVVAFVTDHVRTPAELQLLMTIIQSGDRWWDATSAARESGLTVQDARRALDFFGARNLLEIKITGDVRYQFRPGTPELRSAAEASMHAFRARPLDVAQLVTTASSPSSVRDFADAFRVRRKTDG
jgi:hypothetical protein